MYKTQQTIYEVKIKQKKKFYRQQQNTLIREKVKHTFK